MKLKQLSIIVLCLYVLISCKQVQHIAEIKTTPQKIEANTTEDAATKALIAPYKKQLDAEMNKVIGICAKNLIKEKPESTLGNWMCDALHQQSETFINEPLDFTIVNHGGLRIPNMSKGDITKGKIFELMPFDNMIVILEMDGKVVKQLFDHIAAYGGWPVSRQVQFVIEGKEAKNIKINGDTLDFAQTYRMSISDYVANGGDKCFFLKDQKRVTTGKLIRDALLEYVEENHKKGKTVDSQLENRISLKQ